MTPGERTLLGLVRWLNAPKYSYALTLSLMVIAGFVGHFL